MSFSIKNLKIRNKLAMMVVLPIFSLIIYMWIGIGGKYELSNQLSTVSQYMQLSKKISALVHELQKERGMTAGYIGSKGQDFFDAIISQRRKTNQLVNELNTYLVDSELENLSRGENIGLTKGVKGLKKINSIRERVSNLTISGEEAIGFYTKSNAELLGSISDIAAASITADISVAVVAYINFLQSKERAGIERAVLSATFAQDKFTGNAYRKLVSLVSQQNAFNKMFLTFADDEGMSFYKEKMRGRIVAEAARMREVAFTNATTGNFGVSSSNWFSVQTKKINLLKSVEDNLVENLIIKVNNLYSKTRTAMFTEAFIVIVVLFITVAFVWVMSKLITQPISLMNNAVEDLRVGDGDLTYRLPDLGVDEVGATATSLNGFIEKIQNILIEVKEGASQLSTAAQQVSETSQLLSSTSSEQAASIEETSASLEEMSASIQQNAENSKTTDNLATSTSGQANEGGGAVKETVEAMSTIAAKIGVIEDIAYKTNLLALNAAIEAARAGEHGKGFAVVADEVRKLAERSQNSAQEISDLASNSVKVAERAGSLINDMVPNIQETADLVQEISAASNEQASGVEQVTLAVEQLDKAAQNSASSSEELAATAEEMFAQTEELKNTIDFFKLDDEPGVNVKKISSPEKAAKQLRPEPVKKKVIKKSPASPPKKVIKRESELSTESGIVSEKDFERFK